MLFLTCTEHTSTMSPELMKLRIIMTGQIWNFCIKKAKMVLSKCICKFGQNFRDDVCRIESQKAMKCVLFVVNVYAYVKWSSSHAQNTLQPCLLS